MVKFRRGFFVVQIVLVNLVVLACWLVVILDKPERAKVLFVLLPLQLVANFAVIGLVRKIRISGLTVVFALGLLFAIFGTVRTREWSMLISIPLSLGLIVWSVKVHRRALSKRIVNDGFEE